MGAFFAFRGRPDVKIEAVLAPVAGDASAPFGALPESVDRLRTGQRQNAWLDAHPASLPVASATSGVRRRAAWRTARPLKDEKPPLVSPTSAAAGGDEAWAVAGGRVPVQAANARAARTGGEFHLVSQVVGRTG